MPLVGPIEEDEAVGEVERVFAEIRSVLGTAEVPHLYRVLARIPLYLETTWRRWRFAFVDEGALGSRTKTMVALAVAASHNNRPMILEASERLKRLGATDSEIAELMAVVDVANGLHAVTKAAGSGRS